MVSVRMVMVVVMVMVSAAIVIVFIFPICGFCPRALKYTKKVSFLRRIPVERSGALCVEKKRSGQGGG